MSHTFHSQGFKNEDDKLRKGVVSDKFADLEKYILEQFPACRERSIALTNLETAAMWATKALTHGERPLGPGELSAIQPRGAMPGIVRTNC